MSGALAKALGLRGDWKNVLGMNARNARVAAENPPGAIRLVDSKLDTKKVLEEAGVPVPPTLSVLQDRRDLRDFDLESLPDSWVLKPDRGRQGSGILVANGQEDGEWKSPSGHAIGRGDVEERLRLILEGEFSSEEIEHDRAFFETLIVTHPTLARLVPSGLPDLRLICYRQEILLGMIRLPTKQSDGKANLHQGAIGALVDLDSGRVEKAMFGHERVEEHPDTQVRLVGVEVPAWEEVIDATRSCFKATNLGFLGVDAVIDEERGPLVLEINARPGLEIQNVAGIGLLNLLSGNKR
ncbi:MAG: FIG002781: Alpha-L-glutamate ligase family protein [uncultured Rubrobacteraceae bacterium]|uniref:FIG002781: Alpha-L-glutamate ligase family protein n=1 Tax=uncultured Rubrobacteraceae bacterium TaxID=349277 RepID=A0A6J4QV75_9ACTN|nr:MAG: FIG002781: Alpha-L-glutamate ligase family protein [uncultured Rubrobacteraceae bacterium]